MAKYDLDVYCKGQDDPKQHLRRHRYDREDVKLPESGEDDVNVRFAVTETCTECGHVYLWVKVLNYGLVDALLASNTPDSAGLIDVVFLDPDEVERCSRCGTTDPGNHMIGCWG